MSEERNLIREIGVTVSDRIEKAFSGSLYRKVKAISEGSGYNPSEFAAGLTSILLRHPQKWPRMPRRVKDALTFPLTIAAIEGKIHRHQGFRLDDSGIPLQALQDAVMIVADWAYSDLAADVAVVYKAYLASLVPKVQKVFPEIPSGSKGRDVLYELVADTYRTHPRSLGNPDMIGRILDLVEG